MHRRLPEIGLSILALFFFVRELGTFPAAWADDSLFMVVAREVAAGRGYNLPILGGHWYYPYTLGVGPTLILPVATAIKLFGFSVTVARLPMVGFLVATTLAFFVFAHSAINRAAALWSTLLLVTLSAFVNTGKPVLGEVPALFFLFVGLLLLQRNRKDTGSAIAVGFFFGLSVLTKITFGLVYPALALAWLLAAVRKDWATVKQLTIIGIVAVLVYLPWFLMELMSAAGLLNDFAFLFGGSDTGFAPLGGNPGLLLRPQYLYAMGTFALGAFGLWQMRSRMDRSTWTIIVTLIVLFALYFLSSFGWYRHLLPAHVLILPFAAYGAVHLLGKKIAAALLIAMALAQGYWQWDHRGSSTSTAAAEAATYLKEHYTNTDLVIQQVEVFVRLPENPHWIFLTSPLLSSHLPQQFVTPSPEQRCLPVLGVLSEGEERRIQEEIMGKYAVFAPPDDCPQ